MRTSLARLAAAAAACTLLAACGGNTTSTAGHTTPPSGTTAAAASAAPQPTVLDEEALRASLLAAEELPSGFTADKPNDGPDQTYCNYTTPSPDAKAGQDFEGDGATALNTYAFQFTSAETAMQAIDAERTALKTCHSFTSDGVSYDLTVADVPALGDDAIGVAAEVTDKASGFSVHTLSYSFAVGAGQIGLAYMDLDKPSPKVVDAIAQKLVAKYQAAIAAPASDAIAASSGAASGADATPLAFNADDLMMGNAKPTFPAGAAGKVDVVSTGTFDKDSGILPIAFRNNTEYAISHVDLTGTARKNGKLIATGTSQGTDPAQIPPGGVGLAYIYFGDSASVAGATYEFKAETVAADDSSYNTATLKVTEADNNGKAIVGSAVNDNKAPLTGPYAVRVYCFQSSKINQILQGYANEDADLDPGATATFTVDMYGDKCRTYALGVTGYFS